MVELTYGKVDMGTKKRAFAKLPGHGPASPSAADLPNQAGGKTFGNLIPRREPNYSTTSSGCPAVCQ